MLLSRLLPSGHFVETRLNMFWWKHLAESPQTAISINERVRGLMRESSSSDNISDPRVVPNHDFAVLSRCEPPLQVPFTTECHKQNDGSCLGRRHNL